MATCFVVMGFKEKTDYQTGRKLNLDRSYENLIKPAVAAAGLQCLRADEIQHSGDILIPMYEQLLAADVVVADISTMNPNAIYELGVRHALKPATTIIIAEDGLISPFDVRNIMIRRYRHLGEDIGATEARRFQGELADAIRQIMNNRRVDSPVYTTLRDLQPPQLLQQGVAALPPLGSDQTMRALMDKVANARRAEDWKTAKVLLKVIADSIKPQQDSYIIQQLALATYKADGSVAGLAEAAEALSSLSPETSNDPETLGLSGAIHKRLWESTTDRRSLDAAITAHERGFYLRNDHYNGINLSFLLNVRASISDDQEATADRVLANRVRKHVIESSEKLLKEPELNAADKYWAKASIAEALFGLGRLDEHQNAMDEAIAMAPEPWMIDSTTSQIAKLRALLQN